jgi:hypothetical protein
MSRKPARFTQSDIYRALKAVQQSGLNMAVEISPDGTIRLLPVNDQKPDEPERELFL